MEQEDLMRDTRKIHVAADHAGFEYKESVREWLISEGYEVIDHGAYDYEEDDDYPDFVAPAANAISREDDTSVRAIIFGGSGQGEAIVANRFPNVRAVVFNGQYVPADGREVPEEIVTARNHNDANVLSLGARFLSLTEVKEAVELFLETEFSGEVRHVRRIEKIGGVFRYIQAQDMSDQEPEDKDLNW
ncbi:RpiB/LacA/LacB family sugar-phosphate isomerase [Candidatus Pacebacteria bacterium]|nr:RpiB/LacA/LacB family sugar-phosphate isomerase [Candidatus Paceibacterota bacterium]